ncbi:uncharacterized protein PV09_02960 [Verruconis gallopava]|uniref:AB hydrolase-1 domain-containing protein n=1 Tax=Verruconis gallopava TaxID=253628 RepID=A0A0D2AI56_9PEZI|nr:uncharacterized protein PV09_02960 [Verruconis gallopava]KIW06528.1 hypothetical protein PV09_02960 [Verruconis gallopava]
MSAAGGAPAIKPLWYKEIEPQNAKGTIIFIHGLFSSSKEWDAVTSFVPDYHLIVVDLPGHTHSKHVPWSLDNAVEAIHRIVTEKDLLGKVHIVGLSLGGFVTLSFARRYPGGAKSIVVSGATPLRGWSRWFTERSTMVYYMNWPIMKGPDWFYWWLCRLSGIPRHDELRAEIKQNFSYELTVSGLGCLLDVQLDDLREIERTRVALFSGGKHDDFENARAMARIIRQRCEESKAFVVRKAIHAWDIQYPDLFANGVVAWIEGRTLPTDFEELT